MGPRLAALEAENAALKRAVEENGGEFSKLMLKLKGAEASNRSLSLQVALHRGELAREKRVTAAMAVRLGELEARCQSEDNLHAAQREIANHRFMNGEPASDLGSA